LKRFKEGKLIRDKLSTPVIFPVHTPLDLQEFATDICEGKLLVEFRFQNGFMGIDNAPRM